MRSDRTSLPKRRSPAARTRVWRRSSGSSSANTRCACDMRRSASPDRSATDGCEATNLPWVVDAVTLAAELGIRDVWVINDLEANAYGLAALGPADLVTINKGAANGAG